MLPNLLNAAPVMVADTLVTLPSRDVIALTADLAIVIAALAVTFMAIMVIRHILHWQKVMVEVRGAVRQNLGPVSDRARSISDNVQFVTQAVRTDVERLNASVKSLTDRLHQASGHMEERIEEFNALMEVVQSEAEGILLDTAATVRGVRAGARAMGQGRVEGPAEHDPGLPSGEH
jgi:hypothetical protein